MQNRGQLSYSNDRELQWLNWRIAGLPQNLECQNSWLFHDYSCLKLATFMTFWGICCCGERTTCNSGGTVSPQRVQGTALVGVQRAKQYQIEAKIPLFRRIFTCVYSTQSQIVFFLKWYVSSATAYVMKRKRDLWPHISSAELTSYIFHMKQPDFCLNGLHHRKKKSWMKTK